MLTFDIFYSLSYKLFEFGEERLIHSIRRFNELRKVRNKSKPSGVERPFSRMYNFFVLESGDKWARTGTKFRPRNSKGLPTQSAGVRQVKEVSSMFLFFLFFSLLLCFETEKNA